MTTTTTPALAAMRSIWRLRKAMSPVDQAAMAPMVEALTDLILWDDPADADRFLNLPIIEFDELGLSCDVYSVVGEFRRAVEA